MENTQSINIAGTDFTADDLSDETKALINRYAQLQTSVSELSATIKEQSALIQMYAEAIEASVKPAEEG